MESECNVSACSQAWSLHFTEVALRRRVREQGLCAEHGALRLDQYRTENRMGPGQRQHVDGLISFDIEMIVFDYKTNFHQVYLREVGGTRLFVFTTGYFEASTLYNAVNQRSLDRPPTHVVMANTIRSLGGRLQDVRITHCDADGKYYCAQLTLLHEGQKVEVDLRPTDAIALALYSEAPILISESILS